MQSNVFRFWLYYVCTLINIYCVFIGLKLGVTGVTYFSGFFMLWTGFGTYWFGKKMLKEKREADLP